MVDESTLQQSQQSDEIVLPHYLRATTEPGAHLTMDARVNSIATTTLIDSGATGIFMHQDFAQNCGARIQSKKIPQEVRVIDGRVINSGLITHEATFELEVGNHRETIVADLTNTGRYHCILGTPWLIRHDPTIRWPQHQVIFDSDYCQHHCIKANLEKKESRQNSEKRIQNEESWQPMPGLEGAF